MRYINKINKIFILIFLLLSSISVYCQQQDNSIADYYKSPISSNVTFSFAQLTDIHISITNSQNTEDLANAVNDINKQGHIAFVIVSGDIAETGDYKSLNLAKKELDKLNCPYFIIPGNHDTKWSESGATDFIRIFGDDKFRLQFNGFVFLGFNSGPIIKMGDGHIAPQDIQWVERQLKNIGKKTPVFLVTHYPFRYEVLERGSLAETEDGERIVIDGKVESMPLLMRFKAGLNKMNFRLVTASGVVGVSIFNRAFLKTQLTVGTGITVIGKFDKTKNVITASDIKMGTLMNKTRIEPVYHCTSGLTNKNLEFVEFNISNMKNWLYYPTLDVKPAEIGIKRFVYEYREGNWTKRPEFNFSIPEILSEIHNIPIITRQMVIEAVNKAWTNDFICKGCRSRWKIMYYKVYI